MTLTKYILRRGYRGTIKPMTVPLTRLHEYQGNDHLCPVIVNPDAVQDRDKVVSVNLVNRYSNRQQSVVGLTKVIQLHSNG